MLSKQQQTRAASLLAVIYVGRMLGMFMIFPVFSLYAMTLPGQSPLTIGLALGIYGLTQGILQIPMGKWSDRFGRKRMLTIGLLLFCFGSILAGLAENMYSMIIARALQGAGAISAICLAYATDLTSQHNRGKIMAIIGASIGTSFVVSLIIGPLLAGWFGVRSLFFIIAGLALISLAANYALPDLTVDKPQEKEANTQYDHSALYTASLCIMILHGILTATFLILPKILVNHGMEASHHWWLYLPANLLALVFMRIKAPAHPLRFACDYTLLACAFALFILPLGWFSLIAAILVFFVAFYRIEAGLPTWVSLIAPPSRRGEAMGVFSTMQFIGSFIGGAGAGMLWKNYSETSIFNALLLVSALMAITLFILQRSVLNTDKQV